jgi:MFS family permease
VRASPPPPPALPDAPLGYRALIRGNANFRLLWAGSVVSLLGDWFNTIALYALVRELTGSALALGGILAVKLLPWALASPLAGVLADRFDRRRLMIASDLIRAGIVLGFLVVDTPAEVPLLYVLAAAQVVVSSVFQPAKNALLPLIVARRGLVTANTILSATWSTMLAVGAAAGGVAAGVLGNEAVFVLDSLTYLVSASLLWRLRVPAAPPADEAPAPLLRSAWGEVVGGWRYLVRRPDVGRIALAKAVWTAGGGGLILLATLAGEALTPGRPELGMGLVFSARGLGTGIGPILARSLFTDPRAWPAVLGGCIVLSGVCYAMPGVWPLGWIVLAFVFGAHLASGSNWVLSTVLLQERADDAFRGRVFATQFLLLTLLETVSTLAAGALLEWGMPMAQAFLVFGSIQVASGLAWLLIVVPRERRVQDEAPA